MIGLGVSIGIQSGEATVVQKGLSPSYSNEYNLNLDGTEHVEILSVSDQNDLFRGDFSYQFWIYDSSMAVSYALGAYQPTGENDYDINFRFVNVGTRFVQPSFLIGSGGSDFYNVNSTFSLSAWNHIVVTVKKGATASDRATMKTYLNSSLIGTYTTGPTKTEQESFSASSSVPFLFGARGSSSSANNPTSAIFDELAFWSSELDADAVTALYNSGESIALDSDSGDYDYSSDLKHWFRFENDYSDETGNASDGIPSGTPSFGPSNNPPGTP
jgi:hypothetical protein